MAKPSILDDIGGPYATKFIHTVMEAAEIGTPANIEPHLSRPFLLGRTTPLWSGGMDGRFRRFAEAHVEIGRSGFARFR